MNRHVEKVPSTSLSKVEAWLPVIVVLSMVAVPNVARPPAFTNAGEAVGAGMAHDSRARVTAGAATDSPRLPPCLKGLPCRLSPGWPGCR